MLKKYLLIFFILLQGCSVYMAADGEKEPNISGFHKGMSRFQVESVLGPPSKFTILENNQTKAIYTFVVGNEPNSGRAALWLVADLVLVFLPELIGTPYELSQGETKRVRVIYDEEDMVTNLEI